MPNNSQSFSLFGGAAAGFSQKNTIFAMIMKTFNRVLLALLLAVATGCASTGKQEDEAADVQEQQAVTPANLVFGIDADRYELRRGEIRDGETMGGILASLGLSAADVDRLDRAAKEVFPLRNIRAGHRYTAFMEADSARNMHLRHLAYERNPVDYVVFDFMPDSVSLHLGTKPCTVNRTKKSATITSSLWGAIMEQDLPYSLAAELEDIYQWTVDFFGIQDGDSFTVIYDEKFIDDTVSVGISRVWGARFTHGGKDYYAIPYKQDGKLKYWEADGASLRKMMLKAPLKYTRISSTFSYARRHPITKRVRPHTGVDYAAPAGTPVHSVADGVVIYKGWGGGGGNTLKIKHAGGFRTGYLHLSRYAKGIVKGSRVSQGQLIGYVGSTGMSTGPHLDYRIWKNGKPINPLKVPQEPAEPISAAHRERFEFVRDHIIAELQGDVAEDMKIKQLDSVVLPKAEPLAAGHAEDGKE